jgi:general secretion pathway protein K
MIPLSRRPAATRTAGRTGPGPTGERGLALVVVLWVVAASALMVSAFNAALRTNLRVEVAEKAGAERSALLWAGVDIAVARMLEKDPIAKWEAGATKHVATFAGRRLGITIADHSGRVDLNIADERLVRGLLAGAVGEGRTAEALTERLLDWRDADRDRRANGAEAGDYRAARLGWGPADGDFQTPQMLLRVLGADHALAKRLAPLITVYSSTGKLNPKSAPGPALLAVPGMTPALATLLAGMTPEALSTALNGPQRQFAEFLDASAGPVYSIEVSLEANAGEVAQGLEAVILLAPAGGLAYRLLGYERYGTNRRP